MHCKPLLFAALAALFSSAPALAATQTFKVNGQTITKAEQDEIIKNLVARGQQNSPELEAAVKNQLIRQAVLLQEAKKAKTDRRGDVKKAVQAATDNIVVNAFIAEYAQKHPVSDADARKVFNERKALWGDTEVQVRHILVKDKSTAERLLSQIRSGADFGKLAEANSIDTQQNRGQGGLIPWTSVNLFDKDFANGFKDLKEGALADAPIQSRLGWHVVKLEGRRPAQAWQNYDAYAPQIKQALLQQRINEYQEGLLKKARITNVAPKAK